MDKVLFRGETLHPVDGLLFFGRELIYWE